MGKMLKCLNSGLQPSDDDTEQATTSASIEHFLMIDNGGAAPKVLFDWATDQGPNDRFSKEMKAEYESAARGMLTIINKMPKWYSLGNSVYQIAHFFLSEDDPLLLSAVEENKVTDLEDRVDPADLLPILTVADEAVFRRLNAAAPALPTNAKNSGLAFTICGLGVLQDEISDGDVGILKGHLSILRKYCVVLAMDHIRNDSDTSSESEDDDDCSGG